GTAVEIAGDLRPDLVPRASDLLTQVSAERSQEVGELLRVPAVLVMPRDRCTRWSVILGVVLVLSEPSPPLLAWFVWPCRGRSVTTLAMSLRIGLPPLRHRSPPLKRRVGVIGQSLPEEPDSIQRLRPKYTSVKDARREATIVRSRCPGAFVR